jgi:rhodanese-related sulfurtransferase/predicted transcriptional regulator
VRQTRLTSDPERDSSIHLNAKRRRRAAKALIYDHLATVGRAVGSRSRLELLELLAQGERSVEILARESGLSVANASQHLQILRRARLVRARKQGPFVHYALASAEVPRIVECLRRLGTQAEEVDRLVRTYFSHDDDVEAVRRDDLLARVREGAVVVLDVRPEEEYRAGHVRGAISIPLDRLERRLAELPRDVEIVAYCRGPYCVMSCTAVDLLREKGFRARRLQDGFPEWWAHGFPTERRDAARS